ncbi:thioredoxin family protein [Desulfatibacillum aliphaticivorans]|uniref:Thioredoxin domain protein n=1 Tax=Desulfatibacillum aliphaticivorans TaxID=218208 RepID=B8FCX8_DESAL|nr:thioredoxin family protein [Desulfatibacillum aliphaticivorans]ACL06409.1 Thioredoxin domain protein [Desulfatibacillum aliphaticivorans]
MKRLVFVNLLFLFMLLLQNPAASQDAAEEPVPQVPTPGMVTMLDLGAHKCIPCKMMAPVIQELQKEYQGRASVIFIDVWQNREEGAKYNLRAIPTQIFYDKTGKEVSRHVGYMDKNSIVAIFDKLGVPKTKASDNAQ